MIDQLLYFINNHVNSKDLWNFILYEQPGRCGWRHMYNYSELDLISRFCFDKNFKIDIDLIMDYLKAYKTFNITYKEYKTKKIKYDIMIFNIYYNNLLPKLLF